MAFKKHLFSLVLIAAAGILLLAACGRSGSSETGSSDPADENSSRQQTESEETDMSLRSMNLYIDGTIVPVIWEENDSVAELRRLARDGLKIDMSRYGGFEQVGHIGHSITRNDLQTITRPGDIVLYSGNQLVVFFGSNSWAYTRLGKIDMTGEELTALLSEKDVEIELRVE